MMRLVAVGAALLFLGVVVSAARGEGIAGQTFPSWPSYFDRGPSDARSPSSSFFRISGFDLLGYRDQDDHRWLERGVACEGRFIVGRVGIGAWAKARTRDIMIDVLDTAVGFESETGTFGLDVLIDGSYGFGAWIDTGSFGASARASIAMDRFRIGVVAGFEEVPLLLGTIALGDYLPDLSFSTADRSLWASAEIRKNDWYAGIAARVSKAAESAVATDLTSFRPRVDSSVILSGSGGARIGSWSLETEGLWARAVVDAAANASILEYRVEMPRFAAARISLRSPAGYYLAPAYMDSYIEDGKGTFKGQNLLPFGGSILGEYEFPWEETGLRLAALSLGRTFGSKRLRVDASLTGAYLWWRGGIEVLKKNKRIVVELTPLPSIKEIVDWIPMLGDTVEYYPNGLVMADLGLLWSPSASHELDVRIKQAIPLRIELETAESQVAGPAVESTLSDFRYGGLYVEAAWTWRLGVR